MRALLVDDNANVRNLVRRVLARRFEGLDVVECEDGVEALHHLSGGDFALLLLDVSMPFIGGLDVLESVRRSRTLHALPVIVMTGVSEEETVRRALKIGVNDFIVKPLDPARLCERVLKLLGTSAASTGTPDTTPASFQPLRLESDDAGPRGRRHLRVS